MPSIEEIARGTETIEGLTRSEPPARCSGPLDIRRAAAGEGNCLATVPIS